MKQILYPVGGDLFQNSVGTSCIHRYNTANARPMQHNWISVESKEIVRKSQRCKLKFLISFKTNTVHNLLVTHLELFCSKEADQAGWFFLNVAYHRYSLNLTSQFSFPYLHAYILHTLLVHTLPSASLIPHILTGSVHFKQFPVYSRAIYTQSDPLFPVLPPSKSTL